MQSSVSAQGCFVWFELLTTDVPAAIAFYSKVIGWETEKWAGAEAHAYTMWKVPGHTTIGGVMDLPEAARAMGTPSHWMGNLHVTDVNAAVAVVEAEGGQVYQKPFDIPGIGRVAIVADPTGAGLALYQAEGEAPGHAGPTVPGEVAWSELMTADPEAALAFYSKIVPWQKYEGIDMGPTGIYQTFGPTEAIGGMMKKPEQMPVSAWSYVIHVADLDQAIATAVEQGGVLCYGPMPVPGGSRVASLLDPQGAMFSLLGA